MNILVPHNVEGRLDKLKQINLRKLQQEIIDNDLSLDESYMNLPDHLINVKEVNGHIILNGRKWIKIPKWLSNVKINGYFDCSDNQLTTLENCPQNIGRSLFIECNQLTTLKGCPEIINGSFSCLNNQLTSLEYGPKQVNKNYYCDNNKVKLDKPVDCIIKGRFINE